MKGFPNPNSLKSPDSGTANAATPVTGKALWIALICLLSVTRAYAAGSFYYDFAGGIAQYKQTSPFFGKSTQGTTNYGYALNNGIFFHRGSDKIVFAYQLGIQHRLSGTSDGAKHYAVQAAYPVLRFQFSRLYIGGGYTPFVWRRSNATSGVDYFSRAASASALLAEAGTLFPITPKFSFGAQASAQFISQSGVKSPSPIWDATASMRFYFGFFGSGGNRSSGEFTGWRYPFGQIR